jgi:hypothetical protein
MVEPCEAGDTGETGASVPDGCRMESGREARASEAGPPLPARAPLGSYSRRVSACGAGANGFT